MGGWANGLLDNDSAQDWLGVFASEIKNDIIEIHEQSSRKHAGTLCAAVGILLRLSRDFDPFPGLGDPPHFYPRLICAISANVKHLINFPGNSPQVLAAVLSGKGQELAERPSKLKKSVSRCLHEGQPGILQSAFSKLEDDMFAHPSSKSYIKLKTKRLIKQIDEQLTDHECILDMHFYPLGAMLAIPLLLPLDGLRSSKIQKWQDKCKKTWASKNADEDTNDIHSSRKYRRSVLAAFKHMSTVYGG